jgi:hypothetical protein
MRITKQSLEEDVVVVVVVGGGVVLLVELGRQRRRGTFWGESEKREGRGQRRAAKGAANKNGVGKPRSA